MHQTVDCALMRSKITKKKCNKAMKNTKSIREHRKYPHVNFISRRHWISSDSSNSEPETAMQHNNTEAKEWYLNSQNDPVVQFHNKQHTEEKTSIKVMKC